MDTDIRTSEEDLPFLNFQAILATDSCGRLHEILIDVDPDLSEHIIPNEDALNEQLLNDMNVIIKRIFNFRKITDIKLRIDPGDIGNDCTDVSSLGLSIAIGVKARATS